MRSEVDGVEIKEPPIREFEKKSSCARRCCFFGCGFILLCVASFILLLRFASAPRIKELAKPPENFPSDIKIYDEKSIHRITVLSGKDRGWVIEKFALIPKAVIAPIYIFIQKNDRDAPFLERFQNIIEKPITDHRDVVEIEWTDLSAKPKFLQDYYQAKMTSSGYETIVASETDAIRQFSFTKENISGVFYIKDDADREGTDLMRITIRIPIRE